QPPRERVGAAAQRKGRVLIDALRLARWGGTPLEVARLEPKWLAYAQLADARGRRPATHQALRDEARAGRYLPGDGELPLAELLEALPADLPVAVEAPCREHAARSAGERGRLAGLALPPLPRRRPPPLHPPWPR